MKKYTEFMEKNPVGKKILEQDKKDRIELEKTLEEKKKKKLTKQEES